MRGKDFTRIAIQVAPKKRSRTVKDIDDLRPAPKPFASIPLKALCLSGASHFGIFHAG
jgi:hypothetical protein